MTSRHLAAGFALALLSYAGPALAQGAPPLKVGVIEDMSSMYSEIAGRGAVAAAELAIEDAGGQVLGRKIELLTGDHQNKADVGAALARRWYGEERVGAIAGLGNSSVALAVRAFAREHGRIDMVSTAGVPTLSGEQCSPTGFQWTYNTYANAKVLAESVSAVGAKTWFFLTTDYAFGAAIQEDMTRFVQAQGGRVVGAVKMPLGTQDFASFILQAQASKAEILVVAAGGGDLVNAIKQIGEFGLAAEGQRLIAPVMFIQDVKALGPKVAQGLFLTEAFYWDLDERTRAFAQRFRAKAGIMPNGIQAGVYGALHHYLKAVARAGTDDPATVAKAMRAMPVEDVYTHGAPIRADGQVLREEYLFKVKAPSAVREEWDLYERVRTVEGAAAFQPLTESRCPAVVAAR